MLVYFPILYYNIQGIVEVTQLFRFQIRSRAEKKDVEHFAPASFSPLCLYQGKDEQWTRAMEYVSLVSELNYMTQVCKHRTMGPRTESLIIFVDTFFKLDFRF